MPLTFHHKTLSNGLDVIAELNPDSHSTAAGFFVRAGSRDEPARLAGVSHFLEHMMFKGSAKYTWEDVNRIFDELGARYNAYTSQEMTAYYANVLPEFTRAAVEHLSHLLRPAIRNADFDTEKKVILEEIAMYLDEPDHRLYERLMHEHFGPHPLAASVLGSAESIAAMQRDDMADYFASRYGPGNMVLAVTGRAGFDDVLRLAEEFCGRWERVHATRSTDQPRLAPNRIDLTDEKLNRSYTMALMPGPSAQDDRRFAAKVLQDVVGDAEGSRLYWALVDNAIAEQADFGFYPHDGCGSFYLSLVTGPDRAEQALDIARAELAKARGSLDNAEVERARNKIESQIVLSGEVPLGRLRAIGTQWLYNGDYRSLEQDMAILRSITVDSLRNLMRDYSFDPMTIVRLGPGK
jgi:predicted Zn-dependent peptidase